MLKPEVIPAVAMSVAFFAFGVLGIVWPDRLRKAMDNFADSWKDGSWHPYRMPIPALRILVGGVGIGGALLFVRIAYLAALR